MKKKNISRIFAYVLHQIYNERSANWALLVELFIVSSVVWYAVDCSYTMIVRATEPTGFDASCCYQLQVDRLDKSAVGYDETRPDSAALNIADQLALIDRVRHDEDIEAAAYSMSADPYSTSNIRGELEYDTLRSFVGFLCCQPDMFRVFRYKSTTGRTTDEMVRLFKDRNVFVSEGAFGEEHDLRKWIGQQMKFTTVDKEHRRLADVILPVKRDREEELFYTSVIMVPMPDDYLDKPMLETVLSVRVKEGRDRGFADRFREKIKGQRLRVGNYFVSDVVPYSALKEEREADMNAQIRNYTVTILFLLANVFLGLLGTFWFRTQHRFSEIGLQKVMGATKADITLRLLAEAILLLTIAFIPSLLVDFGIAQADLTEYYRGETFELHRFCCCAAMAYGLMLLIMGLGIWFPALRAVKANPVEVLRGE